MIPHGQSAKRMECSDLHLLPSNLQVFLAGLPLALTCIGHCNSWSKEWEHEGVLMHQCPREGMLPNWLLMVSILGPANTGFQSTWVRTGLFKYTKSNGHLACGIKYGNLLLEFIKMVEITQHKWDISMYNLSSSSPLVGRTHFDSPCQWGGGEMESHSSPVARGLQYFQEKDSRQIRHRSQSQPVHTHNAPYHKKRQFPNGHAKCPSWGFTWPTLTPPNWDEILRKAHGPWTYPLSCIPWQVLMCFPSPKWISMGQELPITRHMHMDHAVAVQTRATLDVYSKHTDLQGQLQWLFPFKLGDVYCLGDLGLGSTDPQLVPPTSHTNVAHVYSVTSGSFDRGLGSGYSTISLTVGGELMSVIP